MSIRYPVDALLPPSRETDTRPARLKPAVFLPIAIAMAGVMVILFGGLPVRDQATAIGTADQIDPVVTGSVQPAADAERRHALEMLDR
jgi:hypothetical protein